MRPGRLRAAIFIVLIAACDTGSPGQVSTGFDGGKQLVLTARYSVNAQAIGIVAWADTSVGTAGTIEMTGPLHMHCDGTFQPVPSQYNDPGNRPTLDVGDAQNGAQLHAPSGHYKVVVSIPSIHVQVSRSFDAGPSTANPITQIWDLPLRCVRVADSKQQLADLSLQYAGAVQVEVGEMAPSTIRERLAALSRQAYTAVSSNDDATALNALIQIRTAVAPTIDRNPDFTIYRVANVAIALLTQATPAA